jgi:riboflavin kinase/FMN adenylyltransferase
MSASDFVTQVLIEGLGVRHVVIGYDFFFGAKRAGNPEVMRQLGEKLGFEVTVVSPTGVGGLIYSSTGVRDALEEGQVRRAAEILGRNWQVDGTVKSGAGRGEGLGFPTANIDLPKGCHLLHGIYAAFVHFNGQRYKAAAYYGKRPSFDNDAPVLEVYLFDFDGNLYGREISVEFVDFVRGDMKFSEPQALRDQMDADCRSVLEILGAA